MSNEPTPDPLIAEQAKRIEELEQQLTSTKQTLAEVTRQRDQYKKGFDSQSRLHEQSMQRVATVKNDRADIQSKLFQIISEADAAIRNKDPKIDALNLLERAAEASRPEGALPVTNATDG